VTQLYADENFPLPVSEALREHGHDVLTMQEDGKANQRFPDEAVLATARDQQRVLLTTNRKHFIRLHNASEDHHGIIVCTFNLDFGAQAAQIDQVIRSHTTLVGKLIRVNRPLD
jgi:predicted nuclease of predicted toxin-antitoxin system